MSFDPPHDFPRCPECGSSNLAEERRLDDFNDPSEPNGHGQDEYLVTYCSDCGEIIEERIV